MFHILNCLLKHYIKNIWKPLMFKLDFTGCLLLALEPLNLRFHCFIKVAVAIRFTYFWNPIEIETSWYNAKNSLDGHRHLNWISNSRYSYSRTSQHLACQIIILRMSFPQLISQLIQSFNCFICLWLLPHWQPRQSFLHSTFDHELSVTRCFLTKQESFQALVRASLS